MKYEFLEEKGTFCLEEAENVSNLYFPIAGENGVKSAVTPNWGGDSKLDQNHFLLEPVSIENLHNAGILFYIMEQNVVDENRNYMQYTMERNQDAIATKIDSINMPTQFFLSDDQ